MASGCIRRRASRKIGAHARLCFLAGLSVLLVSALAGCAATTPENFVEEPGVPARVRLTSGESMSGTLVGMEDGMLVVHHSVPKSTSVTVVRSGGADIVNVHGTPIGTAVEVRDVDILVRERIAFFEVEDVRVVRKAYFGWGTAIAAGLAFALVQVLEDL
jgi:hypothetical protein